MRLQRASSGGQLNFNRASALTCGGEGCIYPLPQDFSLLAKVYHEPNQERARKLACMVAHPLEDPMAAQGHVSVAWPVDLLRDVDRHGQVVGFLMRRVNDLIPIVNFYNPSGRRQSCPLFNWYYLHQTARNLAAAFAAIHRRGDLVADVNSRNILASQRALVTLVDTDSFQVCDPKDGHVFRCPVGTAEYTPPELQNCDLGTVDRKVQHDCFGLAIILFQLLMEGTHPFAGTFLGGGDPPPYEERIRQGHFPYSEKNHVPYRPMPIAPPLNILFPPLQHLFIRCFEDGHRNPYARPDAQSWQNALEEASDSLIPCTINIQHRYGKHLASCPWCERSKLLGGRDPFPSAQVVQKGQHLQPLKPKTRPRPQPRSPNFPAPQFVFLSGGSGSARSFLLAQTQQPPWTVVPMSPPHQFPNLAPTFPGLTRPRQDYTALLAIIVTFCFGLAFLVADDWRHRVLYAGVALLAGSGRQLFQKYPNLLSAAGIGYTGFTFLMIVGVLLPLIMEPSWVLFLFALPIPFALRRPKTASSFFLKYAICALCAFGSFVITNPSTGTIMPAPVSKTQSITEINQGESLRVLAAGSGNSPAMAWSPDGNMIARASFDGPTSLWNARSGALELRLSPDSSAHALSWNSDKILATGSSDGTIKLWNTENGSMLTTLNQAGGVTALAWSPNGKTLAGIGWDATVTLWRGLGISHSTFNNTSPVISLAWSPDSKLLVTGGEDGSIRIWDAGSTQLIVQTESTAFHAQTMAWSPDGKTIASAGLDNQITLWKVSAERSISKLRTLDGHNAAIQAVAWRPNGNILASASDDHTVRLWDPVSGTLLHTVRDPEHSVQSIAWSPDSGTLAIGDIENITLWNVSR